MERAVGTKVRAGVVCVKNSKEAGRSPVRMDERMRGRLRIGIWPEHAHIGQREVSSADLHFRRTILVAELRVDW